MKLSRYVLKPNGFIGTCDERYLHELANRQTNRQRDKHNTTQTPWWR